MMLQTELRDLDSSPLIPALFSTSDPSRRYITSIWGEFRVKLPPDALMSLLQYQCAAQASKLFFVIEGASASRCPRRTEMEGSARTHRVPSSGILALRAHS